MKRILPVLAVVCSGLVSCEPRASLINTAKTGGIKTCDLHTVARTKKAMQHLMEGQEYYRLGQYENFCFKYGRAWYVLPDIEENKKFREFILLRYCSTSFALARQFQKEGNYEKTLENLVGILSLNGNYEPALPQLTESINEWNKKLNKEKGNRQKESTRKIVALFQVANEYYHSRKYNEANRCLHNILRIDPYNIVARRWTELIDRKSGNYYYSDCL